MFQSFFDEVLKPTITCAVTQAVKDAMMQRDDDLIDVAQAAAILNVSKKTIYRYCDEGPVEERLAYTRPGGKRLLRRKEVENYSRKGAPIRLKHLRRK